jgi:glycosyltransferase involved in cell wall biosynthesis
MLTIVGDGPDRGMLENLARSCGLSECIEFAGRRSRAEVVALLEQSDVFVLPSFAEGVPVVLMEALAAGVPVVATRIAGVPELVEHGANGLLAPPGDSSTLARHIGTLLNDPDLRDRLGRRGRSTVQEHFDVEREAARLLDIMTSTISSTSQSAGAVSTTHRAPLGRVGTERA